MSQYAAKSGHQAQVPPILSALDPQLVIRWPDPEILHCCWTVSAAACVSFCQNDTDTNGTGIADVAVRKVVAPSIPGNPRISQTKTVGFVFTFTITVFVNSVDDAQNVVMTDQLPRGLELESVPG